MLARLAADVVAGLISREEADRLRQQAGMKLQEERLRVEELRAALPLLQERLAEAQERDRQREAARLENMLAQAVATRETAEKAAHRAFREARLPLSHVFDHRNVVRVWHGIRAFGRTTSS